MTDDGFARYAVLCEDRYYPTGWDDYVGRSPDLEVAYQIGREHRGGGWRTYGWFQVIDLVTCEKLYDSEDDPDAEDVP